jgi:tripartite ATP-independent transporter DctM subunit
LPFGEEKMLLLVLVLTLVVLFSLGMPVVFSLMISSLVYLLLAGIDPRIIIQKIILGPDSFVLLAVPFFILAAQIMNSTGITKRIFRFASTIVGHFPGGLAHVNIVDSMIFAGMSGSAIADASGAGLMEIEAMVSQGYAKSYATAVSAASSTIGPIIPPSIPMVIYAVIAEASVGKLFLGGIIPGIMMGLAMMVITFFIARKRGFYRDRRATLKEFFDAFKGASLALSTVAILLGGIYTGVFTPTEAAAIAALYALFLGTVVYRELGLRDVFQIFSRIVISCGFITFIISTSAIFSWIIAREQVPQRLAEVMLSLTTSKPVILLIMNVLFLILGMLMDTNAIMLIFLPIVLPVVKSVGIDLVHFGVVVTLNLMIGLLTPPFGVLLFLLNGLTKVPIEDILREVFPYIIVLVFVLFLITYWEGLVMFLPNLWK